MVGWWPQSTRATSGNIDRRTCFDEFESNPFPYAATGSGYERNFSCQSLHKEILSRQLSASIRDSVLPPWPLRLCGEPTSKHFFFAGEPIQTPPPRRLRERENATDRP
jgi:hypothetical protein